MTCSRDLVLSMTRKRKRNDRNVPERMMLVISVCRQRKKRLYVHVQVTLRTPKKSLSLSSAFFPFPARCGEMTTSPQCFGIVASFFGPPALDDVGRESAGVMVPSVVLATAVTSLGTLREVADPFCRSVACGCSCGCGWRAQISMTELVKGYMRQSSVAPCSTTVLINIL